MAESWLDESKQWFAIHVWAAREPISAAHLRARGYEVFLPMYRERRRWVDRVKIVDKALFPGYLFCRSVGSVLGKVVTAPGVIHIVGDGYRPTAISTHEIEALQRVVAQGVPLEPADYLRVGQRVRIEFGPLQGTEGVIQRVKHRDRLILSVTALQRSVAVEVAAGWLITLAGPCVI